VLTLTAEQVRPAPEFGSAVDTRYVTGIGALGERMLILVDIERLMTSSEMALVDDSASMH
jgi:purine-binding chemotaxis protein CheW